MIADSRSLKTFFLFLTRHTTSSYVPENLQFEHTLDRLGRIRPQTLESYSRLGIHTLGELLKHFPRRYEDRRHVLPFESLEVSEVQAVSGQIVKVQLRRLRRGKSLLEASIEIPGGKIEAHWFNQAFLKDHLQIGATIHLYGKIQLKKKKFILIAPEYELERIVEGEDLGEQNEALHTRSIVPVYPATQGLTQRTMRHWARRALELTDLSCVPNIPQNKLRTEELEWSEALHQIHFPDDFDQLERAQSRLRYEEYFLFATKLHFRRKKFREKSAPNFEVSPELHSKIKSLFPFQLTGDQENAIEEISQDLSSDQAMYRLVQGDVGTGKTVIALYSMLAAIRHGYQAALMAPTEVLANQHYQSISSYLKNHPQVQVRLLTGTQIASEKKATLNEIHQGQAHLVVGTQSLIQKQVRFKRLGLVVIDEQHRFGIRQRSLLHNKGVGVHVLVMTATPIPRALSNTAFGDLDLTTLKERPPGRKPVKTYLVSPDKRTDAIGFVKKQLAQGRQAFFVYPSISGKERPSATQAHRELSHLLAPHKVGLLHGKLSPEEKERELEAFRQNQIQALASTIVIEVGIDIPNASVLFIEDGTRFGLAQLHQLRGRVGRGGHEGYCLIGTGKTGNPSQERLKVFSETTDGFAISEADLKLRGPGDFLGVDQSGWPPFKFGQPHEHLSYFTDIRQDVSRFWTDAEFQADREALKTYFN